MRAVTAADGGIRYDPFDSDVDANAHDVWRRLRDEAPLYRNDEHDFFALSRYTDVLEGLLDTETYSSAHGTTLELMTEEVFPVPVMIFRDPPDQTRLRSLVSRAFTPRAMARLETRVEEICAELLDPHVGSTSFDYVQQFAALLPPTVILALIGFPKGYERAFRDEVDAMMDLDDTSIVTDPSSFLTGSRVLWDVLPELIEMRRREPADDLLSVLVNTELECESGEARPLTDEELQGYIGVVAGAGTETVARLLSFAAVLLSDHPEQQRLLRDDHTRIPDAVEELLRYEAPSPVQARRVTRNVVHHGTLVPAGSRMLLLNGSGNRDERHFADADTFDVTRTIDRHLSFGHGAHFCLGAALARLEARIALRATFERFPEFDVDHKSVNRVHTSTVRGYSHVPIRF